MNGQTSTRCATCGHLNRPGKKFCAGCGESLSRVCERCGAQNEPDSRFCDECGSPLAVAKQAAVQAPALAPPPRSEEERRLVTVLFADVAGSTALGEALDPEDVRSLMGRYYAHARTVIAQHGGTVEKFIGDAVMAIFGMPNTHGDDPERALAAGLALHEVIAADQLLAERLQLRIGINTGEVVARSDHAGGDFLVTGDAVNVSARLQQHAAPGETLAGERTRAAVRAGFLFGPARLIAAKGKAEPLNAFPLTGKSAAAGIGGTALVGREEDLLQLGLLKSRALRERRPQLVSIVAPAGTGKTTLLQAFIESCRPEDGFRVAVARCLPYGQTLTYWPLRGLLADLLGEEPSRERMIDSFLRGGYEADDAERLADLVLAPIGLDAEGGAEREREAIFNAWQLLLEGLALQAPLIVVFEDLHWGSDSLLDLVEHVMSPRTRAPILIIGTSRPELLDRRQSWGGGRQSFTALALAPLSAADTRALVQSPGSTLPEPLLDTIVERSGGNPFFAIELTRVARERGDLDRLPDTVHGAVLARVDLLSPDERSVLQAAAVAGRTFRAPMLESILGEHRVPDVEGALGGLLARDLVVPADGPTSFTFRHILIRDVAYGMLSRADRVRMHAAVGLWLEKLASGRLDEYVELIAYHYREAVLLAWRSAVPIDLPIEPSRAVRSLRRAGELAGAMGAFAEAREHLRSAIEIAEPEQQAELYETLGDSVGFGDWSTDAYREALQVWRESGERDPLIGARLLRKMLVVYMRWQGSVGQRLSEDEMLAMREEALRLSTAAGDEEEIWRFRASDIFWPFWRGGITPEEHERGVRLGHEAADYFERREDWEQFHTALDGLYSVETMAGNRAPALDAALRRVAAARGRALDRQDAVSMVVEAALLLGQYDRAIETSEATLRETRPGDPLSLLSNGNGYALLAAMLNGQWDRMGPLLDVQWRAWDELKREAAPGFLLRGFRAAYHVAVAREDRASSEALLGVLERLTSPEYRQSMRWLERAYATDDTAEVPADYGPPSASSAMLNTVGLMFLSERNVQIAAADLERYRTVLELGVSAYAAVFRVAEALASGDPARLREAIESAERDGLVPHAARMRIVLAQMTGDSRPLAEARPLLERLGDRQFLGRLNEVAALLDTSGPALPVEGQR